MIHPELDDLVHDCPTPEIVGHLFHCPRCRRDRTAWGAPTVDPHLPDDLAPGRFAIRGVLGRGGMGTVLEVMDTELDRAVAVKLPHDADLGERLLREARTTARLQHPAVVAVHHTGRLRDGRPYYAMRIIRGGSLRATLDAGQLPLRRSVALLQRVCDAMAFVHEQGVVHRDLKPENVGVGDFDELTIVDMGLSASRDAVVPRAGTPLYVAPEVLRGAPVAPAADVYAIGVMLFEVLAHRLPAAWEPLPAAVDATLADWCTRARAEDPSDRPTAADLRDGLRDWLEGARRLEEARELFVRAAPLRTEALQARAEARDLRTRATVMLAGLSPQARPADKVVAWELERRANDALLRADGLDLRYEHGLATAIQRSPDLTEARLSLAEHWKRRLLDAEHRRDLRECARYTTLLRQEPVHAAWLDAPVPVSVTTDPPGVPVVAELYEVRGRRLVPGDARDLGPAPAWTTLSPGSWRLRCGDLVVPLHVERDRGDPSIAPGGEPAVHPVDRGADDGTCLVPAGWMVLGGDDLAPDAFPRRRVWVDAFRIGRFPVTAAQYLAFLNDLAAAGNREEAERFAPRLPEGGNPVFPPTDAGYRLPDGTGPDFPVTLVNFHCARAYVAWRAEQDGVPWRLPTEIEWEKAARGVDGRIWPWGDHFEVAWARTVASLPVPRLGPVQEFPDDESVYGVRGLAGGVRDWTASAWTPTAPEDGTRVAVEETVGEHQVVRGGAWTSTASLCRPASRFGGSPSVRYWNTGFRLARALG